MLLSTTVLFSACCPCYGRVHILQVMFYKLWFYRDPVNFQQN